MHDPFLATCSTSSATTCSMPPTKCPPFTVAARTHREGSRLRLRPCAECAEHLLDAHCRLRLHRRDRGSAAGLREQAGHDLQSAQMNAESRFWHDINHVRRQPDFGLVDEPELPLWHLGELEHAGHQPGMAWRLLPADLLGHAYVQASRAGVRSTSGAS